MSEPTRSMTPNEERKLQDFAYAHLPTSATREMSERFFNMAIHIIADSADGRMQAMALTKLWEAKNCAVMAVRELEKET